MRVLRVLVFPLVACVIPCVRAGEVIDVANLDTRGLVFEGPRFGTTGVNAIKSARGLGDVNGDGFDDIGLLAHDFFWGNRHVNGVLILFGRPATTGRWSLEPSLPGWAFFVVTPGVEKWSSLYPPTALGDVNGDGLADFSMTIFPDDGSGSRVSVLVVYGSRNLMGDYAAEDLGSKIPGLVCFTSDPGMLDLRPAVPLGDINGDGSTEYAIGAPTSLRPQDTEGAGMFVILTDLPSLSSPVDLALVGHTIPGSKCCRQLWNLGLGIQALGDVDGDGYDDFAAAAWEVPGQVYVIHGERDLPSVLGPDAEKVTTFIGPSDEGGRLWFGKPHSMASLGDLNGDGYADLALGISRFCCRDPLPGPEDDPAIYGFYGGPSLPRVIDFNDLTEDKYAFVIRSPGLFSWFGWELAGGDLNGDGLGDLVIGAPNEDTNGLSGAGEAYVVYGRRDFPKEVHVTNAFEAYTLRGEGVRDALGTEVSQIGDFNGDRLPDMLFLARHIGSEPLGISRVYILYGEGPGPQPLKLHSIDPSWGTVRGGASLTLNGAGFEARPEVFFGDRPAANVAVRSKSQLRVETPPGASVGLVDVTVRLGEQVKTLVRAFEYTPNVKAVDLDTLGNQGFIVDAQPGVNFTFPAISALAFGDLSRDGIDDLVIEATAPNGWSLTVIRGGADLPESVTACDVCPRNATVVTSESRTDGAGATVNFLGDVNGDGHRDLGIGAGDGVGYVLFAPLFDAAGESVGVFDIDQSTPSGVAVKLTRSDGLDGIFTLNVVEAGDITGDGIDDFAVGFAGAESAALGARTGEVLFVAGRREWPEQLDLSDPASRIARLGGSQAGKRFAQRLRAVGDVNRDGVRDFLADTVATLKGKGRAYLIYGSKSLPEDVDVETYISQGGGMVIDLIDGFLHLSWFNVSAAGDVNADGFADVLVGVEGGATIDQGVMYLLYGRADLPNYMELAENPAKPDGIVRIFGEGAYEQAGRPGPAGDYNVDGYADFVIGAPGFQKFGVEAGNVFLIFGGPSLPPRIDLRQLASYGLKIDGRNITGAAGFFAGPAGDFNGDGLSDFAFSEGYTKPGDVSHVYVI